MGSRKLDAKYVIISIVLIGLIASSAAYYLSSSRPTETVQVTAWTYVISHEHNRYYLKNGSGMDEWSSTNATRILQASCDNLTQGGTIFVRAGTYELSRSVSITYNGTSILGEGIGATRFKCTTSAHQAFIINGKRNCRLAYFEVDGNRDLIEYPDPPTIPPRGIELMGGAEHNIIEEVLIYNHADGIGIDYGSENTILNCMGYDNKFVGIAIGSNFLGYRSYRNTVSGGEYWSCDGNGIEIFSIDGVTAYAQDTRLIDVNSHSNEFSGVTVAFSRGVYIHGGAYTDNGKSDITGSGIQIYQNAPVNQSDFIITGVFSSRNRDGFVSLSAQGSAASRIQAVTLTGCLSVDEKSFLSLYVAHGGAITDVTVVGNIWRNTWSHGIDSNSAEGTITDIIISSNTGTGAGAGINSINDDYWIITGNNFRGHDTGINITGLNNIVDQNIEP